MLLKFITKCWCEIVKGAILLVFSYFIILPAFADETDSILKTGDKSSVVTENIVISVENANIDQNKDIQSILMTLIRNCADLPKEKIFEKLKALSALIPLSIYWVDPVEGISLGGNKYIFEAMGASSSDNIIGKTAYEFYPYDIADKIVKFNRKVAETGKAMSQEESIKDVTTGEIKYFISYKAPLFDDVGDIVCVVGISSEIKMADDGRHAEL